MTTDGFVIRPLDIQGQVLREFGVILPYPTALAGRNKALESIFGEHEKSFQMLPKYLFMLKKMNPGSVVDLQTSSDSSFEYCFFALAASIRGFRACRPVIVIDATHLRGKYKGVMFVASTKDGNEQILPLAFGIGDKECDLSWTWFLQRLKDSFGQRENLLIVSDQHCSIQNAVGEVYPGTPHVFCTYHIQGKLKGHGEAVIKEFNAAARAHKETEFDKHMRNISRDAPTVHAKLIGIGPVHWASSHCPVRRFEFRTSNAVEVLNGRLKWARGMPVTSLLEYARKLVQSWFYKRRKIADERVLEVNEYAERRLSFSTEKASTMSVQPISDNKFNIIEASCSNIVDLRLRECSCKVFQSLLIPCSHAIAAIRFRNETPLAYVHAYYSTNTWREVYATDVMPVTDPSVWCTSHDVELRVVRTPSNPKQAGRPKKNRIPSEGLPKGSQSKSKKSNEEVLSHQCPVGDVSSNVDPIGESPNIGFRTCSRCHLPGHYVTTCTTFIGEPQIVVDLEDGCNVVGEKRRRNPKSCGICGIVGHTRRKCQDPIRFA